MQYVTKGCVSAPHVAQSDVRGLPEQFEIHISLSPNPGDLPRRGQEFPQALSANLLDIKKLYKSQHELIS